MKKKKQESLDRKKLTFDDVFAEAAWEVLEDTNISEEGIIPINVPLKGHIKDPKNSGILTRKVVLGLANLTEEQKRGWDDLTAAMTTKHAERFNAILNKLPPKEFVRVYLRALEYFKPKITRQDGIIGGNKAPTINIQINRGSIVKN